MATANGKVILCGEHAVVYGVPAIAAGIERGARAQARRADASRLVLGNDAIQANDGSDVGKAFGALLATLDERDVELRDAAIWALGQIGGQQARRTLRALTKSDDESLREAARESLAELELFADLDELETLYFQ